jgi:hypothetical protein
MLFTSAALRLLVIHEGQLKNNPEEIDWSFLLALT